MHFFDKSLANSKKKLYICTRFANFVLLERLKWRIVRYGNTAYVTQHLRIIPPQATHSLVPYILP
jgi:hypothetical protein